MFAAFHNQSPLITMTIQTKLFIVSKLAFFQRGLSMLLVKTCNFFLYLFSVKEEHEIRFNHVLNRKETFFDYKNTNFSVSKMASFQRGEPILLVEKCNFFKFFFSLKIRLEVRVNNVLDRKKTFFGL